MEASEQLSVITAITEEARERGLYFQSIDDERLAGRRVTVGGERLLSFSSCSYLGLEFHPALIAAVHDAVDRYGTQFSSSRAFLSAPLYAELEALLSRVFGGHALVTPSTSLGHQAALSALVTEKDAIVYDHQAHYSVQTAVNLARSAGAHVELVHHADVGGAIGRVARLARRHRTVWFACDGVYSMYGDTVSAELVRGLLDAAPNVRLYVDDAHGMSWAGESGRGSFLSRFALGERVVLATSLNKAFSAAGGCLVFASRAEREWVRNSIGALAFSGPLQPPMLGAAVASAKVHLGDEIYARQRTLAARVALANRLLREAQLDPLVENETPIFFVPVGATAVTYDLAAALREREGIHASIAVFPAVPVRRSGLRLALTAAHEEADVVHLVAALARQLPAALARHNVTRERVRGRFRGALWHGAPAASHDPGPAAVTALRPVSTPPAPAPFRPASTPPAPAPFRPASTPPAPAPFRPASTPPAAAKALPPTALPDNVRPINAARASRPPTAAPPAQALPDEALAPVPALPAYAPPALPDDAHGLLDDAHALPDDAPALPDDPFASEHDDDEPGRPSGPHRKWVPIDVEVARSIHEIDRELWDRLLGGVGACSWDALAMAERVFRGHGRPEHDWDTRYVLARHGRHVVGATFFTTSLNKDDMLMRGEVSRAAEARRRVDPHFLTSLVTMAGSPLSEGEHVYLDRQGPYLQALDAMVDAAIDIYDEAGANALMLRDLPADDGPVGELLAERGFAKVPMLDSYLLDLGGPHDGLLPLALPKRKRQHAHAQAERSRHFVVERYGAAEGRTPPAALADHLYGLYRAVAARKVRVNVFPLPRNLVDGLASSPAWEIVTLRLRPESGGPDDGAPVGWYAAHRFGEHYAPFLCGLDDRYAVERGVYRQMLYQAVVRARELGARLVHLGVDAEAEKARFGAEPARRCFYVQARDHYNGAVMRDLVADVGAGPRARTAG
jgi:7-keto-8-aminopelargonate synthetase-like enzyme